MHIVLGVRGNIGRVHIVELDYLGSDQDSYGGEDWIPILVQIDPGEGAFPRWALDEHGVVRDLTLLTINYHNLNNTLQE